MMRWSGTERQGMETGFAGTIRLHLRPSIVPRLCHSCRIACRNPLQNADRDLT
jgi:hypothetical protein